MPEETKIVLANQRVATAVREKAVQEILQRLELLTPDDWAKISERVFIFGKPAPSYLKYQEKIQLFIEKNKIRPLAQIKPLPDRWVNGGMFVEFKHIHLNNNTYLLDDAQFEALDKDLVKDFKFSLKNAGEVKF
jgi:hypothetical protein